MTDFPMEIAASCRVEHVAAKNGDMHLDEHELCTLLTKI